MGPFQEAATGQSGTAWKKALPKIPGGNDKRKVLDHVKAGVRELWAAQNWPESSEAANWGWAEWWAEWYERQAERWLRSNRFDLWQGIRTDVERKKAARAARTRPAASLPYRD
ncbi:MAG: hypothetical protein KIS92_20030 [Planctomycetota bacterium]|nr:hypothetical protein [Planctomycetota bacterium]